MKNGLLFGLLVYAVLSILRGTTGLRLAPQSGIPPEYINIGLALLSSVLPYVFSKFPKLAEILKQALGVPAVSNLDGKLDTLVAAEQAELNALTDIQRRMVQMEAALKELVARIPAP